MMVMGEIAKCGAEGARTLSNSQAKRTVTGLYSGEHARAMGVTDGEPI